MLFRVENQKLTAADLSGIIGKTVKFLTAEFEFDDSWDGWTKTAWFEQNGVAKSYLLVDDEVPALSNLNLDNGICKVYVSATMGDVRRTTSIVTFSVIHTGSLIGTVPEDTPLTVIEQMTAWLEILDDTGNGTKYLANDGSYKEVESNMAWLPTVDASGNLAWSKSESRTAPEPVNIKGENPHIGENGNWYIGDTDSGIDATGKKYARSKNLLDITTFTSGYFINRNIGTLYASTSWSASDYIDVREHIGEKLRFTVYNGREYDIQLGCFYDTEKNHISGSGIQLSKNVVIPDGAGYFRFSIQHVSYPLNKCQLEFENITHYREYGTSYEEKPHQNLSLMVLGDSISRLTGYATKVHKYMEAGGYVNIAVSSATMTDKADTGELDGNPKDKTASLNTLSNQVQKAINNQYPAPDIIIISAGINDRLGSTYDFTNEKALWDSMETYFTASTSPYAPIDINSVDRTNYFGAARYVVEKLRSLYPNANVYLCTCIQSKPSTVAPVYAPRTNRCIKALAERLGVGLIDTYNCGITTTNHALYLHDGLHENDDGKMIHGKYVARKILTDWYNTHRLSTEET